MKNENKKDPRFYFIKNPIKYLIRRLTHNSTIGNCSMNRADFPLILIGIPDYVEGATRLQKYGFLAFKKIKGLAKLDFYNDWIASNYGPFSPELASDLVVSEKLGLIQKHKVVNAYGYVVERFALRDKNIVEEFKKTYPSEYKQLEEIIKCYQSKTLADLLQEVYYQYPEYATASKIKAEIGKKIYESDSYLSPLYDTADSEY